MVNTNGLASIINNGGSDGNRAEPGSKEWEMRPGGMLVQMRTTDSDRNSALVPTIRVRVKYGSIYHEVNISSQATFGELKKMLSGPTGLHHEDQKLLYKDKERDSKAFLDMVGVKDKSKIVLVEDPISQEKRLLERRKNAKMEKAAKSISEISLEVDRLAGRVSAFESIISKGGRVVETDLLNLIELLMNQLLKLDGIVADGDVKLQRKMQVKRVQKYVETLDVLKVKNSMPSSNGGHAPVQPQQKHSNGQRQGPVQEKKQQKHSNGHHRLALAPIQEQEQQQPSRNSTSGVVVTTNWELFDSVPPLIPVPSTSPSPHPSVTNNSGPHKFNWEFFNQLPYSKTNGLSSIMNGGGSGGCRSEPGSKEWEMRPGGMLVQMRTADSDRNPALVPTIRVRVKYGSIYHEVNISSQATFGELKKMLSGPTGLHHEDQKLLYKDKERDSKAFLDMVGVKDKSKIVLMEDPISQEKRLLERRKNAKMEKAAKSISEISLEIDRLAGRVSAFESIISKGGKVVETDVHNLIELLMNQLLKLDGIMADGDVKLQRKMQVKRVQKYVETLDVLKVKNSMPSSNGDHAPVQPQQKHSNGQQQKHSNGHHRLALVPIQEQQQEQPRNSNENSLELYQEQQHQPSRNSTSGVVVTTNWELFDSVPPLIPVQSTSPPSSVTNNSGPPKFNWEFFD
ncbi:BAG family molecular chaperone regulator 3 [Glycine soja]